MEVDEQVNHRVAIYGRKQLTMEGVLHVDSFNESEITLETNMGVVLLKGNGLHITKLSLETGSLEAEGVFAAVQYAESKGKNKGKKLLGRILK